MLDLFLIHLKILKLSGSDPMKKSQLDVKRKNRQFIGSFAAYGYLKDPEDKNHLDNMLNTTYYNYKEEGAY